MRPFVKREVIPGAMKGLEIDQFIRKSVGTFWHQTCTAKMGRDAMSVVDAQLKVYGIDRLRIADGIHYASCSHGQHHGPLHGHRRARCGDLEKGL